MEGGDCTPQRGGGTDTLETEAVPQLHRDINPYHGNQFHIKYLFLFHLRCAQTHPEALLATEVTEGHKYNDGVCIYKQEGHRVNLFTQLKHKLPGSKDRAIDFESLVPSKSGPYDLKNYIESFIKIKKDFETMDKGTVIKLTIYTNNHFDEDNLESTEEPTVKFVLKPVTDVQDELLLDPIGGLGLDDEDISRFISKGRRYRLGVENVDSLLKKWSKIRKVNKNQSLTISEMDIEEFLESSLWYVNQPSEEELGKLIRHKICQKFHCSDVEMYVNHFLNSIFNWMSRNEHDYITIDEFQSQLEKAYRQTPDYCATFAHVQSYCQELQEIKLDFNIPEELSSFLRNDERVLIMITPDVRLTSKKVLRALTDQQCFVFMRLSTAKQCREQVIKTISTEWVNILAIAIDKPFLGEDDFFCELFSIVNLNSNKKLIVISEDNRIASNLPNAITLNDKTNFESLTEKSQDCILETTILVQGAPTTLKKLLLLPEVTQKDTVSFVKDILKNDLLVLFESDKSVTIGESLQPLGAEESQHYIERSFSRRVLREDILPSISGALLAVSGPREIVSRVFPSIVTFNTHLQFIENNRKQKKNQNSMGTGWSLPYSQVYLSSVLSEAEAMFSRLAEDLPKQNIHWLETEEDQLIWIRSHGQELPEQYLLHCPQEEVLREAREEEVVLVTGSPGMGKSSTLTSMCFQYKEQHPHCWILRIDLNDFSSLFHQYLKKPNCEPVVTFFINKILTIKHKSSIVSQLEKALLKVLLQERGDVMLILDGFDEIATALKYEELVLSFLRAVRAKRVVSSREHLLEKLRTALHVKESGLFSLLPLTVEQQDTFMRNRVRFLWHHRGSHTDKNLDDLSEELIRAVKASFKNTDEGFTSVPLHLLIISDLYDVEKLSENLTIHKIFKHFIENKVQIYIKEKLKVNTEGSKVERKILENYIQDSYEALALFVVFSDHFDLWLPDNVDIDSLIGNIKTGEENIGIVLRVTNESPVFLHQTIAEYYVAAHVKNIILRGHRDASIRQFIIEKLLVEDYYKMIRIFLDGMLGEVGQEMRIRSGRTAVYPSEACDSVYVSACEGHSHLCKNLLNSTKDNERDKMLKRVLAEHPHCVQTLIERGHIQVLKFFKGYVNGMEELGNKFDLLDWTIRYNQLSMLQWLVMTEDFNGGGVDIKSESQIKNTVVHAASWWGRLQILQWIVKPTGKGGGGADVHSKNIYGKTAAHYAAQKNHVQVLQWLLLSESHNGAGLRIEDQTIYQASLVHIMAYAGNIDTLSWLTEPKDKGGGGLDISHKNYYGMSVLLEAARGGHIETVKFLIRPKSQGGGGFSLNDIDNDGRSALHWAAYGGHKELIKWLIKPCTEGGGLNITDKTPEGVSVLQRAAYGGQIDLLEWLTMSPEDGGSGLSLYDRDLRERTLLHYAADKGRLKAIQWLISRGLDINFVDGNDETALSVTAEYCVKAHSHDCEDKLVLVYKDKYVSVLRWVLGPGAAIVRPKDVTMVLNASILCGINKEVN